MKHQIEARRFAVLVDDSILAVLKDGRPELHMTGLVHAVYVPEGCRKEVAGALYDIQPSCHLQSVLGRSIEFCGTAGFDAVLFPAHDSGLDLEDQIALPKPLEQFHGDVKILLQWQCTAV